MTFRGGLPGGQGGPPPQGGIYLANQNPGDPDPNVTAEEDALVKVTRDRMFPLGTEGAQVPGRRGYGTKGSKIVLRTNYFKITTSFEDKQNETTWYRYDVEVQPDASRAKKRRLFDLIVMHPRFNGVSWATDYGKIIVTTTKLDLGNGEWKEKVEIPPEPGNSQTNQQGVMRIFLR